MSLTLKVTLGSSFFPLAIAKTLPPTFQTCDPPHWITCVVAGSVRHNALNFPRVILSCFIQSAAHRTSHRDERPALVEHSEALRAPHVILIGMVPKKSRLPISTPQ